VVHKCDVHPTATSVLIQIKNLNRNIYLFLTPTLLNARKVTFVILKQESGEKVLILEGHTAIVTSVAFSVDGRTLASTSYDKSSLIWKINEDEDEDHHRRINLISPEAESPSKSLIQSSSVPNLDLPEPLNLTSWTCQDVADWLRDSVQLGQYSQIFIDNVIDGVELVTLTSETLKKDLGIGSR